MKSLFTLIGVISLIFYGNVFPQTWQQLATPQGGGVTDIVYWDLPGSPLWSGIWVTTSSENWPNGQWGGVRLSTNGGQNWQLINNGYIARTIEVGKDGNLYASIWYDPASQAADGLYRFAPQVGSFVNLYQAQAGDNIFSIVVKNSPHTIFAGTRDGVIRSTDNGVTFGYSNNGIPDSAWVYDIAVDSSGILAVASSKGLFISTDNGDNWLSTTGIAPEDTAGTLLFVDSASTKSPDETLSTQWGDRLYTATHDAKLLRSFAENDYTLNVLLYLFADTTDTLDVEITKAERIVAERFITSVWEKEHSGFPKRTGISGIYESTDNGLSWQQINDGLPSNPPVSALALKIYNPTYAEVYAGLFNDTTNGAGIYKLAIITDVKELSEQIPSDYKLEQNYPNPFNPSTTIKFELPKESLTKLEIFNSLGEKVSTLVSKTLSSGTYEFEWDAEGLSTGIYFYRLSAENYLQTKKLLLMK